MLPAFAKIPRRARGFTLLELLFVVSLMVLLASVLLPRMSASTKKARLEEAVEHVSQIVRFGRAEAVRRGVRVRLRIKEDGTVLSLSLHDQASVYREDFGAWDDGFLDEDVVLPAGTRIASVKRGGNRETPTTLIFSPSGVGEPLELVLAAPPSRSGVVILGPSYTEVTGRLLSEEEALDYAV